MDNSVLRLSDTFKQFFNSEKSSGIVLIVCTILALLLTNSSLGAGYLQLWQMEIAGLSLEHWINDGLMALFFLLIGLELERELYVGELSEFRNALLPIIVAIGGMLVPALIHFAFNAGTPTQDGIGIPMATDIAFALGILALLGKRVPGSLKIFVAAYAVIDDLGAIVIIAFFYTAQLSLAYLAASLTVWALLLVLNHRFRIMALTPYVLGGCLMWFFMLKSGIHATISGVMLAFAIPFSAKDDDEKSPSHKLEHLLHRPAALLILPIFALANTGIQIGSDWIQNLSSLNSIGISAGLLLGKPLGVTLFFVASIASGICKQPPGLTWRYALGAGFLGGIGFTMSIFITNLAFPADPEIINAAKMSILEASLLSGIIAYLWLRFFAAAKS